MLEVLKSLRYFIHHHPSISFWNRPAVKSCTRFRRCNRANRRLDFKFHPLHHKVAILRLHDSIHGIAGRSRQDMLRLKQLGGSHAASPLRWRGSFGGSFVCYDFLLIPLSLVPLRAAPEFGSAPLSSSSPGISNRLRPETQPSTKRSLVCLLSVQGAQDSQGPL